MLQALRRLLQEEHPQRKHTLEVELPEEWATMDVFALDEFLKSKTGRKMVAMLYYDMYTRFLGATEMTPYEQGLAKGIGLAIDQIQTMGDRNSYIVADEIDQNV